MHDDVKLVISCSNDSFLGRLCLTLAMPLYVNRMGNTIMDYGTNCSTEK